MPSNKNKDVLLFDLKVMKEFNKPKPGEKGRARSTILTGWNGTFGPAYDEVESTLHMDTFDGYTIFSLKDGWVKNEDASNNDLSSPDNGVSMSDGVSDSTSLSDNNGGLGTDKEEGSE